MQPTKHDLHLLVGAIWDTLLGLTVAPTDRALPPLRPLPEAERIHGRIAIHGAWTGAVTLEGPISLARRVTAIMLGKRADDTSREDLSDAWAELTNITGGNLKATLPPSCSLDFPVVSFPHEETQDPNTSEMVLEGTFDCEGETFRITLQRSPSKP